MARRVPALLKKGCHSDEVVFHNVISRVWFPDESLRGHADHLIKLCQELLDHVPDAGNMVGHLLWILNVYLPGEGADLKTVPSHTASEDGVERSDPSPSMFSQGAP